MKKVIMAAVAACFAITSAQADIRGGDVELPEAAPESWNLIDGKRCVLTDFGDFQMIELIDGYAPIAVSVSRHGENIGGFKHDEAKKACQRA
jgi:hypothetical protein